MFGRKRKYQIHQELSGFTFDHAAKFLNSQKGKDPIFTNTATAMIAALATGGEVAAILASMPSMKGVNADIMTLDALAWSCTTWQRAVHTRYIEDRFQEGAERAWLCSTSVAGTIREVKLDKHAPEIGVYWLDRWNEFRSINQTPHESFGLLTYLLFTSKGHHSPMKRYPGSPPVILDFDLGLESMAAELACGQAILACVDSYIDLARHMPDDDIDEDEDMDEDEY